MKASFPIKQTATALALALVLIVIGVFIGLYLGERESLRRGLHAPLTRMTLNSVAIGYIREGKTTEAIVLLNMMNHGSLNYLKRYEHLELNDPEFTQRKDKVIATVHKEWAEHPRTAPAALKPDSVLQKYQQDVEEDSHQRQ